LLQEMLDLEHNQFQDKDIHIYKVIIEDILKKKNERIFNILIFHIYRDRVHSVEKVQVVEMFLIHLIE